MKNLAPKWFLHSRPQQRYFTRPHLCHHRYKINIVLTSILKTFMSECWIFAYGTCVLAGLHRTMKIGPRIYPDSNLVYYSIWEDLQLLVYRKHIRGVDILTKSQQHARTETELQDSLSTTICQSSQANGWHRPHHYICLFLWYMQDDGMKMPVFFCATM